VFTDPDFVPFEPPERPLGLLGLRTLLRNYIETMPRSAYEQSVTRIRTRLSDVLIVSDPNIIQEILVEKAEAFGRDPVMSAMGQKRTSRHAAEPTGVGIPAAG
jgi:hypothetical protein